MGILINLVRNNLFKNAIIFILFSMATIHIYNNTVEYPYRKGKIFFSFKKLENNISHLKNLRGNGNLQKLITDLDFLKNRKEEFVFTYSRQIGICLLLNKRPFSLDWQNEETPLKTFKIISETKIDPSNIILIIPEEHPLKEIVKQGWDKKMGGFEDNYILKKKIKYYDYSYKKELTLNIYLYKKTTNKLKAL